MSFRIENGVAIVNLEFVGLPPLRDKLPWREIISGRAYLMSESVLLAGSLLDPCHAQKAFGTCHLAKGRTGMSRRR